MKALAMCVTAVALLSLVFFVPGAKGAGDCASYISTGSRADPLTGQLIGQRTLTVTTTSSFSGNAGRGILGGGYSYQRTRTVTYSVGVYRMSDGSTREVRCDTYTYA